MDTATPHGELRFHLFEALAQYERALTQERIRAGRAAAGDGIATVAGRGRAMRNQGRPFGRSWPMGRARRRGVGPSGFPDYFVRCVEAGGERC